MFTFIPSLPLRKPRTTPCRHPARPSSPTLSLSPLSLSRRQILPLIPSLLLLPLPSLSAPSAPAIETDPQYGYSFEPPSTWQRSTAGLSSFRSAIIYLSPDDSDANISMVATPVPGDFQKLTSFGPLDNVLNTLVPTGKDVDGKVISAKVDTAKNAYIIEYLITSKGIERHLLTVFSLQPGRWLLTMTGTAKEANWKEREADIRKAVDSYSIRLMD